MFNSFLCYLNKPNFRGVLRPLIALGYLVKRQKFVSVKYHNTFHAWEFQIKNTSYLSCGPGWSYSFDYLNELLNQTYCKFYKPQPGDCIVDLGAGLGEESVVFAQIVGNEGKVYAIEASPVVYKALEYMCNHNKFTQVQTFNLAIAEKAGTIQIEENAESYVGNTIEKEGTDHKQFEVKALSFDDFVYQNDIKKIDLLKVNIEGAEQFLIEGMKNTINRVKVAAISCHDFRHISNQESEFYVTKDKVTKFLHENDFDVMVDVAGHVVNDDIVYGINKSLTL